MQNRLEKYLKENGLGLLKRLIYAYADAFDYSCVLDSCELNTGMHTGKYELLAGFGAEYKCESLEECQRSIEQQQWLFGILSYDLKNNFEDLQSENKVLVETPELVFFVPETVLAIDKTGGIFVLKGKLKETFWDELNYDENKVVYQVESPVTKNIYLDKIDKIKELIRAGEVYELNYCVPFTHNFNSLSPVHFHLNLLKRSPVPMATFFKNDNLYLCGASMERYLSRSGDKIISQPIKGTIKKGETVEEDAKLIEQLRTSEKDRAENVMIVDLVRNDLARIGNPGTTVVPELFGIYSYLQVHQMISTVTTRIDGELPFTEIIASTFPMGSMTGAPKIAAMKHVEDLEDFRRGWYSGAVGYVSPQGDFDFNVVIRSVICDMKKKRLHYFAGGAITIDSEPEKEWDEVILKTKAIAELINL